MRFILVDGIEIKVFDTLDEVNCSIEPPEVTSGAFRLFDSAGSKYKLDVDSTLSGGFLGVLKAKIETIRITKDNPSNNSAAELKRYLEEYLDIIKVPRSGTASIDELIDLATQ